MTTMCASRWVSNSQAVQAGNEGARAKFWFEEGDGRLSLFKLARKQSGEDWAEVVAAHLAERLVIPHASYELGESEDGPGCISRSFLEDNDSLIDGNSRLRGFLPDYHAVGVMGRQRRQHTLENIADVLHGVDAPLESAPDRSVFDDGMSVFVGYLMFDCWIGNTDRHDCNWAVVSRLAETDLAVRLAPSFDHGSSLGSHLTDVERTLRCETLDRGRTVSAFADRGRSKIFSVTGGNKPVLLLDAFKDAARVRPAAGLEWLARLERVRECDIDEVVSRLPAERMSAVSAEFALRFLKYTRAQLLRLREGLS